MAVRAAISLGASPLPEPHAEQQLFPAPLDLVAGEGARVNDPDHAVEGVVPLDLARRRVLASLLTAYTASLIPGHLRNRRPTPTAALFLPCRRFLRAANLSTPHRRRTSTRHWLPRTRVFPRLYRPFLP